MKFQHKCLLQRFFSAVPCGHLLNYAFQKYVTKSLPQSDKAFDKRWDTALKHTEYYQKFCNTPLSASRCYEFGAGWDFTFPLVFRSLGFASADCVDIRKLARLSLVNDTIEKVMRKTAANNDSSTNLIHPIDNLRELEEMGIRYFAPMDAQKTDIETETIDFFYSNNTLEHIPVDIIARILKETSRIMKSTGVFSVKIDYQDHWASFDKSISVYNYLRYSSKEWQRYNPSLQYQNRLRHTDYMRLFKESGFAIIEEEKFYPSANDQEQLKLLSLATEFQKYDRDDLAVTGCWIVGKKESPVSC